MLNILHAINIPLSILDTDGTIRHLNHAMEKYLDIPSENLIGKHSHMLLHPSNLSKDDCPLCQAISHKRTIDKLDLLDLIKQKYTQYSINYTKIDSLESIILTLTNTTQVHIQDHKIENLNKRMALALHGYKAGVYEWNMVDNSAYLSEEWKVMLGYDKDEPFPKHLSAWKDRVHPKDINDVMLKVQNALKIQAEHIETTHRLKHKDGHWIWILGRGFIQYDENANPLRMVGIHTDISDRISLQLKSAERRKILDHSLNEIYIFNAEDFKFLYINKGAKHNTGYSFTEISKLSPLDLNPNMEKEYFSDILKKVIKNEDNHTSFSTQCQRKNGSLYDVEVYLQATTFENTNAYVAIVLDVTERKKKETLIQEQADGLYYLAHYDMLTGLANRVLLTEKLKQSIKKAKQNKTQLTLLFIDINKFKAINDSFGHHVGDKVLKEIAHRLKKTIREEDTIARFGGDEFIIVLENTKNTSDLKYKIQNALNEPLIINTHSLTITCRIGISTYPNDADTLDKLLNDADKKMYKEKENTLFVSPTT